MIKGILGNAFYSTDFDSVKYIESGIILFDTSGMITDIVELQDPAYDNIKNEMVQEGCLRVLDDSEVILPGFVDLHIHAPQWVQAGLALDRPLEVWLNEYTFPLEAKFKDLSFSKRVYQDIVSTTLKNGTTTAVYFATVDRKSSILLAKVCGDLGQRGLVGKIAMDDESNCPEYCIDSSARVAKQETESFIQEMLELKNQYIQKVYPVVTPRFVPSCTTECLIEMGKLAKKYDVHVQTHSSESDWAHQYSKDMYGMTDLETLYNFGLISRKSLIAHAPFLEDDDLRLMVETGCTIAHSPLSNAFFANSVLPVCQFKDAGVSIGLATDISGGYSPSMYQAIRQAVISSRMLEGGVDPSLSSQTRGRKKSSITFNNAFYLATVAGGEALDLSIGKLEKGFSMDIQVVKIDSNIPRYFEEARSEDLLHKILLLAESSNVAEVWVQGVQVKM